MRPALYNYQELGVQFLAFKRRAYLGDEMGLGKTIQAIVAANYVKSPLVHVYCPAAVIGNWWNEIGKWSDNPGAYQVTSYGSLHHVTGPAPHVIMDEAHYAKSVKAVRTKRSLKLASQAQHAWLLSGTPMPNHPGELFTWFRYLFPNLLTEHNRTYWKWVYRYCNVHHGPWGKKVYGHNPEHAQELADMLKIAMLRRKVDDVALDLPALRVNVDTLVKLKTSFAQTLREEGLDDLLATLAEGSEPVEKAHLARLRRVLGLFKAPHIAERLSTELEEEQYQKIVVMYHHTETGNILQDKLREFGTVRLDGRTPKTKRQGLVDQFTNDPRARVFLGQQTASGTGLNLQAAHEIVLAEPDWTPDSNLQAIKRIHRIGQDNPCRARMFSVGGSLDERVLAVAAEKRATQKVLDLH